MSSLIDELSTGETVDFVSSFAAPLPIGVITRMFGIDEDAGIDTADFARYGAAIGGSLGGIHSLRHARELWQAGEALERMFERLLAARATDPRDDLISVLAAERGDQVQPDELMAMCFLLLVAGFETTVNLLGNVLLALLSHPDQWRLLTQQPELAAQAVEETLRWNPPVQRTGRALPSRTRRWPAPTCGRTNRSWCCSAAPVATRRCFRIRTASTSPDRTARSTWRSPAAFTIAWALPSPGSKRQSRWNSSQFDSPAYDEPAPSPCVARR